MQAALDIGTAASAELATAHRNGRQRSAAKLRQRTKKKRPRAPAFAAFLVEHFGLETLRGSGGDGGGDKASRGPRFPSVLDVAGGQGDLAWCLCATHGVPTTVSRTDPRRDSRLSNSLSLSLL